MGTRYNALVELLVLIKLTAEFDSRVADCMKEDLIESEIRNAAIVLGFGIEFENLVVLLSDRLPEELAYLIAKAGQLFLKYGD